MESSKGRVMASKLLVFFLFLLSNAFATSKLPVLATKQATNNLRFISSDGNFTYYQNREGSLLLSTNYKVKEVITGEPGTQYEVIGSRSREKLVVTQQASFHKFLGVRQLKNIYKIDFGGQASQKIAMGKSPQLHLNDTWVSFFHPITKTIRFLSLKSSALSFEIKISNPFNPYFTPFVVMPNNNTVIYTDLNKSGHSGVVYYDKITKKNSVLYKGSNPSTKHELCLSEGNLFFGEFGLNELFSGSIISKLKTKALDFSKREILYESRLNDLGNIHCEGSLLFVKNLYKERRKLAYEVVELNINDKKVKIISDINFASHIIDMDGVLLMPHLGKYYVLKGKGDFTKNDRLKEREVKP
jgi:hypothetical protein